jgi:hypothetical protein
VCPLDGKGGLQNGARALVIKGALKVPALKRRRRRQPEGLVESREIIENIRVETADHDRDRLTGARRGRDPAIDIEVEVFQIGLADLTGHKRACRHQDPVVEIVEPRTEGRTALGSHGALLRIGCELC